MGKPGTFKIIGDRDRTITPFKVYKSWGYTSTSSLSEDNIERLVAIKPNSYKFSGNKVTLDSSQVYLDSGSFLINSSSARPASIIWYSLDHLYYKRAGIPAETFGYADPYAIERSLFDEATVISIPQKKFGESIKPGSVQLQFTNTSNQYTSTVYLRDDGAGNLIDTELSASISNELLHLEFGTTTYAKNWTDNVANRVKNNLLLPVKVDTLIPDFTVSSKNIWYHPKSTVSGKVAGNAAFFFKTSYIRIPNNDWLNFKADEDFAISFWFKPANFSQNVLDEVGNAVAVANEGTSESYLLSKRSTATGNVLRQRLIRTQDIDANASQYPFEITFNNSNKIKCRQSNGLKKTEITGSINDYTSANPNHIVFQKTGSLLQLYINGAIVTSASVATDINIHNNADIFIGSLGCDANQDAKFGSAGSMWDFFFFNKGLTSAEVTQLYSPGTQYMQINTNAVGNVFYEHGMIVVSDPRMKYSSGSVRPFNDVLYNTRIGLNESSYLSNFYLEYNSTVTLYEHEYVCKIREDEFNFTSNPTIRKNNDLNSELPKSFVANDEFGPYITTVGLYNKAGQLLAIGKLGGPIKKRDTVDLNIIVRFDV